MYQISFDPDARVLHLVLSGFWDEEMVNGFTREMAVMTDRLHDGDQPFGVFNDTREFAVQSPLVMEALRVAAMSNPKMHTVPTAIVVGSMLNKLQATRAPAPSPPDGDAIVRVFFDADEARDWLTAKLTRAQAA